jgi:hypothetical protein
MPDYFALWREAKAGQVTNVGAVQVCFSKYFRAKEECGADELRQVVKTSPTDLNSSTPHF